MIEKDRIEPVRHDVDHAIATPLFRRNPAESSEPPDRAVDLYAGIKRSFKYFHQGLDASKKPRLFRVDAIRDGSHPFRINNNNYRHEDLDFYVKDLEGVLIKL